MSKLQVPKPLDLKPRITVIGVGGAGGNAVNNMISAGLPGVDFIVANTDSQALMASKAATRIQLGVNLTEGLGAGSKPEIGEAAAKEAEDELRARLAGAHMLFIAAGMGGGTGTGATGVIARVARELGILTIAVVTKPFTFEGTKRMRAADAGIADLKSSVDTLIVIPNQNLFRIANERTTFSEAFLLADQVLYSGIACIVDLIVKDGLINLDLADVRTVLSGMGAAVMGTGEASGDRRAILAAEEAITNQLLDNMSLRGAKGLLLSIIGGRDLTLYEVDEAASRVRDEVDPDANIIVGAAFDDSMTDRVRVSIVASGMPDQAAGASTPSTLLVPAHQQPSAKASPPAPVVPTVEAVSPAVAPPAVSQPRAPVGPPPLPPHAIPAGMAEERSADGVRIREHVQSTPHMPSHGAPATESSYPATSFAPQQLVEPRRAGSRVPEINEFPPIGQKEYRAKMEQNSTSPAPPKADAPSAPVMRGVEPKKGTLFQRLADAARGRQRPTDASNGAGDPDALPEFFARDKRA